MNVHAYLRLSVDLGEKDKAWVRVHVIECLARSKFKNKFARGKC